MADEQNTQTVQLVEDEKPSTTPAPTKSIPLIDLESETPEEDVSWFMKLMNFFKSTAGKILIFTVLFLGISVYIVYSSNSVLFKGSQLANPLDINQISQQSGVSQLDLTQQQLLQQQEQVNNKANPFVGSNAIPLPGTNSTIDTTGLLNPLSEINIASQIDQNLINTNNNLGNILPNGLLPENQLPLNEDSGTGIVPFRPTGLTAVCSADNSQVTLKWSPVTNVSPVTYSVYIYDLSNKGKIDALPFTKTGYTSTVYSEYKPKLGQEYEWWVYAKSGNEISTQAKGTNFKCGSNQLIVPNPTITTIDPNLFKNLFGTPDAVTLCGNNQYYVIDSDPTKSGCKSVPSYVGGSGQSDLICGLYSTILNDPIGYKINDTTKATLNAGVTSQCKNGQAQPVVTQSQFCPSGTYLDGGVFPSGCKPIPSVTGLAGDALKNACTSLSSLYNSNSTYRMSDRTRNTISLTINGTSCKTQAQPQPQSQAGSTICPAGTYPAGADIPGSCQSLPNFNTLKNKEEFVSACQLYKDILSAGKDAKMDPKTVQDIATAANSIVCGPQFFSGNGNLTGNNVNPLVGQNGGAVTGGNVVGQTGGQTGGQVNGSALPPMENQDTGLVVPKHPVAGKNVPSNSASTGPEMWIYAIGAGMSFLATRRKTNRKK